DDGLSGIPLILLAKNNQGYQSLIRISAMLAYKDIIRTPFEFLKNNANDLLIIAETDEGAGLLGQRTKVSDDDKYISCKLNSALFMKASFHSVRYMGKEDRKVLKVLNAIRDNDRLEAHELNAISGDEYVLKKEDIPEEIEPFIQVNKEIVEKCNVTMPKVSTTLPHFPHPGNYDSDEFLWQQLNNRLVEKTDGSEKYKDRLRYEFDVITKMGYSDYFLIVS